MTVTCDLPDTYFGMEDQRNYGDASYKAFSSMPHKYPDVPKDQRASQTFTLEVKNPPSPAPSPPAVVVRLGDLMPATRIPKLLLTQEPRPLVNFGRATYRNAEAVTFSFNPAVHMPDDDSLMENIAVIVQQARTVRASAPQAAICIEPVTFNSPYPRPGPDPRNGGLFGAVFSAAVVKQLALAGVAEAIFECAGPYARLIQRDLAAYEGKPLLATTIQAPPGPLPIEAFAIQDDAATVIWLTNKTDQPQPTTVHCFSRNTPLKLRRLTLISALSPSPFKPENRPPSPSLSLTLTPFEVCKIVAVSGE